MSEGKQSKKEKRKGARPPLTPDMLRSMIFLIGFLILLVLLSVLLWPYISTLANEDGIQRLRSFISGLGIGGWFVTLGIQVLQIIIAFLPGEPVELMLGALWGPVLGTLTCLIGILIGTVTTFYLARWLGKPFVKLIVGDKDIKKYKFLSSEKNRDITVLILFLIPGTPKDALSYAAPLTPIEPIRYFLISTLARIPSVVTSTVLGDSILEGDFLVAGIVFAVTAVFSVLGIVVGNKFLKGKQEASWDTDRKDS